MLQDYPSHRLESGAAPERWRPIVVAAVAFGILLAVLYAGVLRHLAQQWWSDDNYSHGFLVPLFSAYLLWQRRRALAVAPIRGHWSGWPLLLIGLAAFVLGDIGAENFLLRSSLIIIIAGLVQLHLGPRLLRLMAFPVAFLLFMVPLPANVFYAIAFPLQRLAAANSAWALDLLGVPVLLDGNVIHLSRLSLGVVEACSGIRSLISLLALAVAWGYLTLPGVIATTILVTAAVPITILANAVRIVVTGLIGQTLGSEYARGFFHTFSGWLIFIVAFGCLLVVHHLIHVGIRSQRTRA
jgi:exosortase